MDWQEQRTEASHVRVHVAWACSASVSCGARGARAGKERDGAPCRRSSIQRTIAREVAQVEALSRVCQITRSSRCVRAQSSAQIVGTNSIGSFAFGLHVDGGPVL